MSSFKNALKTKQKTHRERSQPSSRAHLGFLEKKKDYKKRADDQHRKEKILKNLKIKALNRNPDEFYFKMVHNKKVDGLHQPREDEETSYTDEQLKLMHSQDLKYIRMKRMTEANKIKRLKSELHLLDCDEEVKNKHTIFVDTNKDAQRFDAAKHFQTHPELVNRRHNRIRPDQLERIDFSKSYSSETLEELTSEKKHKYNLLLKRIEREKELAIIEQKMQTQRNLLDKSTKCKKMKNETPSSSAQYKWKFERKK